MKSYHSLKIKWKTSKGDVIQIRGAMTDSHLENCIAAVKRGHDLNGNTFNHRIRTRGLVALETEKAIRTILKRVAHERETGNSSYPSNPQEIRLGRLSVSRENAQRIPWRYLGHLVQWREGGLMGRIQMGDCVQFNWHDGSDTVTHTFATYVGFASLERRTTARRGRGFYGWVYDVPYPFGVDSRCFSARISSSHGA